MTTENETPPTGTGGANQSKTNRLKSNISRADIQAALARGWRLTPLNGKVPVLKDWPNKRPSVDELAVHAAGGGNVGVVCGAASGLVVIDLDGDMEQHADMMARMPRTVTAITGSGGRHLYFKCHNGAAIGNSASKIAHHLDVRGDRGAAVYPGSCHPDTGALYHWMDGHGPDDIPLAELPGWIIEALAPKPAPMPTAPATPRQASPANGRRDAYVEAAIQGECEAVRCATEGTRNARLNEAALKLASLGLPDDVITAELTGAALEAGLAPSEIGPTIRSGITAGRQSPREVPTDYTPVAWDSTARTAEAPPPMTEAHADVLFAEMLARWWRRRIRFAAHSGVWLWWSGHVWAALPENEILARAQAALRQAIAQQMANTSNMDSLKALSAMAIGACKLGRIRAALEFLAGFPGVSTRPEALDANPMALNIQNGILDLRTGLLGPHSPDRLCSKIAPVSFDPAATCPRWLRFLDEVFGGDEELIRYLQWTCGLALTGDTSAQCFFIGHGSGSNGKSTFLNVMCEILGADYSHTLPAEELLISKHERHSTERASLMGKRLVVALETPEGARFNESLLKSLTGGERVRARFMRCDSFEYVPTFKIWLATNHRPRVRDDSPGFWRRVRLIPFLMSFEGSRRDPNIMQALRAEYSGVLNWALAGIRTGLDEPSIPRCVEAATSDYKGASNALEQFFTECVEVTENQFDVVSKTALYNAYFEWTGGRCESKNRFAEMVKNQGFDDGRIGHTSQRVWHGIRLVPNEL